MSIALSLVLVLFFLIMNGFFVVAEFALVRVRKSQLKIAADEDKRGAKSALIVADNVNAYLSACQLGITIASLALGWLGEPAVSKLLKPVLGAMGISDAAVSAIAIALGFAIITTLHIVVGELIPKSLAIFSTEKYARFTAFLLICFYKITAPVMWLFNTTTNIVMKALGHDIQKEHEAYTSEEIQLLIDESTESGLIDPEQNEFVDNVFELYEREASYIMTPRTKLICFDLDLSYEENLAVIEEYKYTRYPVCRGNKDHIEGFVHIKDIYFNHVKDREGIYEKLNIRPITAVSEGMKVNKLLKIFREQHTKIVMVVDEYGGTLGIVTASDIMEQIVGDMDDEYTRSEKPDILSEEDGRMVILGSMPIDNLEDLIGFLPDGADDCDTVAGILLNMFGAIPEAGDEIAVEDEEYGRICFRILSMNGRAIDEIEITRSLA